MYLKSLTVLGFKSFADKTTLNFQPGVTAIVGPNGCGKSNVSDAIRWVLGEQSAKALRGGEMADVIFNGTDSRKPLGLAEVSLTIGGVDTEQLKAAGVNLDYEEITVTRRVFRDGGSEYFINKVACRLKDIQQLFMGTGVGRTSYSIMAQGNITQILSSKPDDRRMVFEEAAGITKFKAQKKETLRKLEYTDQNLLRVADLIREVKRQIGSLQRQAGKARRYKQIAQELQHLETQLARHQYDVLQGEIRDRNEACEKLKTDAELCAEKVNRLELEIARLREQLSEIESHISQTQQRGLELKGQIDRHESRIHFNEERLRELEGQNARALSDIEDAEHRHRVAEEELAAVSARLEEALGSLESQRQALREKQEAVQTIENEVRHQQELLRTSQSSAFSAAQQLSRARNEINALDMQKQGNVVRLEKLASERIQLEEEKSRLETRLQEFAANVEAEKVSVASCRGTVEERQQRLRELQQELVHTSQDLDGVIRQQAEIRSRLNVLEQLQTDHEGFSAGTLAALKQTDAVLGSLADRIRVPNEFITAIETALGHHLQLVLTEQPEAAQQILTDLATNKKGRASIAPLAWSSMRTNGTVLEFEQTLTEREPSLKHALSIVEGDDATKPILNSLLGHTWIAPDLQTASRVWQDSQGKLEIVTPTGEIVSRHGVVTGGAGSGNGAGKSAASILGRKNQIAEIQEKLSHLQLQIGELSRHKGAMQSEQTALQASLQEAQTELRAQEVAIATRQGEFNALQNSQRSLNQKIETVGYELESLTAQEEEGTQKRSGLSAQVGELEHNERNAQEQVVSVTAQLEELRHSRDAANSSLTETKVGLASQEQQTNSLKMQKQPLEQRIREMAQLADQRRNEIGAFMARKAQFETEMDDSRSKIESLQHEREQVNVLAASFFGQKESLEQEIAHREDELRGERRRLSEIQQLKSTYEIELAQKNMSVQNLRERIQQKYQLNIEEIRSECITITIADEGPARIHTLTPEEMDVSGVATDWIAVSEQVVTLQKRIDEIGPVNLVAIEEYEETEQRHQFLTTQYDDLIKAKEQLMEVINRINTQTQELFTETFNKIRDNFRVLFTEIFGGGKADLILTNEGDVLESGIDIVARPPGKQLQSITLLSGGEQTMTAVALLFSIYQVKPSPFCVLDELDAPLDESNINRFIKVLQRFLVHSQFVIITHNKRTIGMADVLYGVTMQEHGISKIVSVKFHKVEDQTPVPESQRMENPPSVPAVEREDTVQSREDTIEVSMSK